MHWQGPLAALLAEDCAREGWGQRLSTLVPSDLCRRGCLVEQLALAVQPLGAYWGRRLPPVLFSVLGSHFPWLTTPLVCGGLEHEPVRHLLVERFRIPSRWLVVPSLQVREASSRGGGLSLPFAAPGLKGSALVLRGL